MVSHIPTIINDKDGARYANDQQRAEAARGLEQIANWIRQTPFPLPLSILRYVGRLRISEDYYADEDKHFMERIGFLPKLIGGKVKKSLEYPWMPDGQQGNFVLTRDFEGNAGVVVTVGRELVCKATETEEEVTVNEPDADDVKKIEDQIKALEAKRDDLPTTEKIEVRKVTKWECPPSLLATVKKSA
jgi:hypothetical protein